MIKPEKTAEQIDIDLIRALLGRLITRNEPNPLRRAAFRLAYAKNMRDLAERPDRHLAGATDIISRHGPTYEAGLQLGACIALCANAATDHHATLTRMLDEIKAQQDGPGEQPSTQKETTPHAPEEAEASRPEDPQDPQGPEEARPAP